MTPCPKTPVIRDKAYLRWVATNPCMKCKRHGRTQSAHIGQGSLSMKCSDNLVAPLCCASPDGLGCHEKLDRYLEIHYWKENMPRALNTTTSAYSFYKAGKLDDAELIFARF